MVEVTEEELYQIIGELFVSRAKTDQLLKIARARIQQLEAEKKNGELEQPNHNDAV